MRVRAGLYLANLKLYSNSRKPGSSASQLLRMNFRCAWAARARVGRVERTRVSTAPHLGRRRIKNRRSVEQNGDERRYVLKRDQSIAVGVSAAALRLGRSRSV